MLSLEDLFERVRFLGTERERMLSLLTLEIKKLQEQLSRTTEKKLRNDIRYEIQQYSSQYTITDYTYRIQVMHLKLIIDQTKYAISQQHEQRRRNEERTYKRKRTRTQLHHAQDNSEILLSLKREGKPNLESIHHKL